MNKATTLCVFLFLHVLAVSSKPYSGGIIRDVGIELPSNEKIYKRSVESLPEETTEDSTTPQILPSEETESDADNGVIEEDILLVPAPEADFLFAAIEENDLFDEAESGLVFRPLFTYRSQQIRRRRFGRSLGSPSEDSRRSRRSLDDLDTAESSIAFRPLFRYRYVQKRRAERRRGT